MQWPIREKTAMEVVGSRMHAPRNVYSQIWCGRSGYFISFNVKHAKYVAPVTVHCGRNVMPSFSFLLKSTMSEPIVVFTWRSILKLPQLWNIKQSELSAPILRNWLISPFSVVMWPHRPHDHSSHLWKWKFIFFWYKFSKVSLSWLHHQLYAVTVTWLLHFS